MEKKALLKARASAVRLLWGLAGVLTNLVYSAEFMNREGLIIGRFKQFCETTFCSDR